MRQRGRLFRETLGHGPEVVLLHGWGMHGRILREFAETLAGHWRVTLFDLPGHGHSGLLADPGLAGIAAALLEQAPGSACWLGWSLGAIIALYLARMAPGRVRALGILAGSPKFVRNGDWPGIEEPVLDRFAQDLQERYEQTVQHFLGLQLLGLADARPLLKELRAHLAERPPPEARALQAGLDILRHSDLRPALKALECPALAVLGRRDRLVPAAAGAAMQALNRGLQLKIIEQATHVPFLTHREETAAVTLRFLSQHAR